MPYTVQAPVAMNTTSSNEKIAMTAPVAIQQPAQQQEGSSSTTM
jgi:hypothetical protein